VPAVRPSDAEWEGLLAGRREATFFHGPVWAAIVESSFPQLQDVTRVLADDDPGVLPLFAWRRVGGLLTTLHSSFPFLYGGPVPARGRRGQSLLGLALAFLARSPASVRMIGNPFAQPAGEGAPSSEGDSPPGFRFRLEATHLLQLPATEEGYWEGALSTAKRNDVRRLAKKGVAIEESRDAAVADQIYAFYLASFARWGGRPGLVYPREFYRNLLRMGGDAVRLTVARHGGVVIGGTFTVRYNGIVHYLAGYFDHEQRALRPNVLIQVESIQRAIRDGYRLYDFLPSGGHRSVEEFKESFGGKRTEFRVYERSGWAHRLLRR
jgi:hypothetical protein